MMYYCIDFCMHTYKIVVTKNRTRNANVSFDQQMCGEQNTQNKASI